jgi:serine protease Do
MSKRMIVVAGGLAVLMIALAALSGPSASGQEQKDAQARSERALQKAQQEAAEDMLAKQANSREELARLAEDLALLQADASAQEIAAALPQDVQVFTSLEDGASWLGVETAEVNAEKTKELKLPAERGVLLTEIVPDSPAAKAGLKANDVVTEFNGQRVEGAAQFRRLIRETPAGRTVQLTVWRDGRSQTISVTLGEGEQRRHARAGVPRGDWTIEMPRIPKVEIPRFEWNDGVFFSRRPMLGISADDLSGQLGSYFGAPDGEGVLVREVNSGSPAEKAGIKAGDVIIKVNGARVRTVGDLHEKLREKTGDGADKAEKATVSIGLLRDRKEMTVNVEIERPQAPKARRLASRRTTI